VSHFVQAEHIEVMPGSMTELKVSEIEMELYLIHTRICKIFLKSSHIALVL